MVEFRPITEKISKDVNGNILESDKEGLLNTMWTTAYKNYFEGLGVEKSEKNSAEKSSEKVEKGAKTVRRQNGKTIKNY